MKNILAIVFCVAVVINATAQTKIQAREIIKQINDGRAVEYSNVEIEGDLDLTDLKNRDTKRHFINWFNFNNDLYESIVDVPVKFTGCTFLGKVLAYYHLERPDETFIAHFEKDAVFTNCVFKRDSEFKYSGFEGKTTFAGCTFNEEANFKYAKFSNGPSFSNVKFESGADFKYTKFPGETSFEKATFHRLANFKYSKFRSPLNMKGVAFEGSEDFKYTSIDGRSFTSYLLVQK
ncbi:hypothetical protein WSM22_38010 [Cytophagales bacterium WSM2-2]|nr:hypothetical protein WSM22_38010 [Cytophagales bacterium WSM2-2]